MMQDSKVSVVGIYNGSDKKWAVGRFPPEGDSPGAYRIGLFVKGGISFSERPFTSREDAEGWLTYHLDASVKI